MRKVVGKFVSQTQTQTHTHAGTYIHIRTQYVFLPLQEGKDVKRK